MDRACATVGSESNAENQDTSLALSRCRKPMVPAMPSPQSVMKTNIPPNLLEELALKVLCLKGEQTLVDLSKHLRLSFAVVDEVFQRLRKERLCEVKGMTGLVHRVALSSEGRARALEFMSLNQYVGPAPVSLGDYTACIRAQSVMLSEVHFQDVTQALEDLVLSTGFQARLGVAVASGTSLFLYGPPGCGKSIIAEKLFSIYGDSVWIPHAVEVSGQIISVYDSALHGGIDEPVPDDADGRWVLCRRPSILLGGELTVEMLDLHLDPASRSYYAPVQMKANNGVLIVDDFGRQLVPPKLLLNRWIVPLDRHIDFLTLAGGGKFEVPFDSLVVFATNLDLADLGDEAFFRRLQTKIKVDYATPEQFQEICHRVCRESDLEYDATVVDFLIDSVITKFNRPLRQCYPRDIVRQICLKARFQGEQPRFDTQAVAEACRNCFAFDLDYINSGAPVEWHRRRKETKLAGGAANLLSS